MFQMKEKQAKSFFDDNILKEINLTDIFTQEEAEAILNENTFKCPIRVDKDSSTEFLIDLSRRKSKSSMFMFDRMNLIMKLLQLSINKLKAYKEDISAKGLEWYI